MTKNTENPKKSEIEAQILEAKNNQVSIKLNKLKFKSPSDLQNRKRRFSASATETNSEPTIIPLVKFNSNLRQSLSKRSSPKKCHNKINSSTDLRKCPVEGCDSKGHISGLSSHHSSYETCPIFYKMQNNFKPMEINSDLNKKYKEKLNENLQDIMYFEQENKSKKTKSTILNPDVFGDIKNLTTSFLVNSIASDMVPSNLISSKSSVEDPLKANNLQQPCLNDLGVSKFEFNLFQKSLVDASKSKEILTDQGEMLNPTAQLKLNNKTHKIIKIGDYEIESWFKSPYPEEIWKLDEIFICQFCLKYMKSNWILNRHLEKCAWRHPPGREIYRKDVYSFFEVDGKLNKVYCQNLCLLAKLFLDHKTLYFDVEPFLFYVLTKFNSSTGTFELLGYFSKEKKSLNNYNLSCILTLPVYMNQGFGKLLIDFSYLLSRVEGKIGSPERPFSDLGLISYRNYWITALLNKLAEHIDDPEISIKDLSTETGIFTNDIISTLQYIGLIKYWKGKHVIIKNKSLINQYVQKKRSSVLEIDIKCLKWNTEPNQEKESSLN